MVQVGAWCFAAAAARCLTGGGASGRVEEHVFRPVALVCLRFEEEPVAAYVFAVQQAVRRRRGAQPRAFTAGIYQIFVHIDPIRGHGRKSAAADGLRAAIARHVGGEGELQIASLIFVRVQIAVKSVVITSAIHPAGIAYASSDGLAVPFFVVGAKKWILACTDIGQSAIIQLDVVVCADEKAIIRMRRGVRKVLEVDIIPHFVAIAGFDLR